MTVEPVEPASVEAGAPSSGAVTVPLRRTPPSRRLWPVVLTLLLGGVPGLGLPLLWFTSTKEISVEVAGLIAAAAVLAAISWVAWLFALPKPRGVTVDDDGLGFSFARRGFVRLALEDIVVCRLDGRDVVVLAVPIEGTPDNNTKANENADARGHVGSFVLPARCFVDAAADAVRVVAAVRARMAAHPQGAGLLARLDDNEARQKAFAGRRPIITWAVAAACAALFVVEVVSGALDPRDPAMLLTLGANAPALVNDGQVWRLVTACLLHGSLVHLAMNLSALLSTGGLLERWLGRSGFAIVVVVTGVVGQLGSAIAFRAPMSVGLSGALFGLLGVLLWSTLRFRTSTTGGLKVPLSSWIFLLITNAFLSTLPFVDVVAHGAGFAAGVAVGALVSPRPAGRGAVLRPRARFAFAIVAGLVVVAAVVAAIVAGAGSAAR